MYYKRFGNFRRKWTNYRTRYVTRYRRAGSYAKKNQTYIYLLVVAGGLLLAWKMGWLNSLLSMFKKKDVTTLK